MKIICAGLSKTGTKSLAAALEILGFTVHDFGEHIVYHKDQYIQAYEGKMPDFAAMYKHVDATVDFPSFFFWKEIKQSFPDAKVILTERDNVESWMESLFRTHVAWKESLSHQVWIRLGILITPTGRKWKALMNNYDRDFLFTKEDKTNLPQVYFDHNARVKAAIPRDELLVYNVKQGWKPLCEFLGVEVPDVPFPRLNVKSVGIPDMINHSVVGKRVFNELVLILAIIFIFVAILMSMVFNWKRTVVWK